MKRYFRVTLFDLTIFSSLVNITSVYDRINKCSYTLHAYGKSMKVQEILHLRASVKTKNRSEMKGTKNMREGERQSDFKTNTQINNKIIKY